MRLHIPVVDDLKATNWSTLTDNDRLRALQKLEDQLATQERRTACQLEYIPSDVLSKNDNAQKLYGQHLPAKLGANGKIEPEKIQINPNLLVNDQAPYAVVETYFHEARHSYQNHIADHPELAETTEHTQDFYKAKNGGYLDSDQFEPKYYRSQPTEIDACHAGQTHTAMLYDQLGELEGYLDYQKSPEYENQRAGFSVERIYAEDARTLVDAKYELAQSKLLTNQKENELEVGQSQDGVVIEEVSGVDISNQSPSEVLATETPPTENSSEDRDYDHSYGYGI